MSIQQWVEDRKRHKIKKWLKKNFNLLSDVLPVPVSTFLMVVVTAGQVIVSLILLYITYQHQSNAEAEVLKAQIATINLRGEVAKTKDAADRVFNDIEKKTVQIDANLNHFTETIERLSSEQEKLTKEQNALVRSINDVKTNASRDVGEVITKINRQVEESRVNADYDIDSLRYLAEVINNPNYPYPDLKKLAQKNYEYSRKMISDKNYDDYNDSEYCGANDDLLRQGKNNEYLSQIKEGKLQIRTRSHMPFCSVFVWGHTNFSKVQKLSTSYEILQKTTNPYAIYYTCMKVETEGGANLKKNFLLETNEYIKWLERFK